MIGFATPTRRPRSRFLFAMTLAAGACLGGIALHRASAQTAPDYGRLLAAPDRSEAIGKPTSAAIQCLSWFLPRRVRA